MMLNSFYAVSVSNEHLVFKSVVRYCNSSHIKLKKVKLKSSQKARSVKLSINTTNRVLYGPVLENKQNINNKIQKKIIKSKLVPKSQNTLGNNETDVLYKKDPVNSLFDKNLNFYPLLNINKKKHPLNELNNSIKSISIFEGGYSKLPSVRNILQKTMPPERKLILEKWEKKMISQMGEEEFKNYRQVLLDKGKIFHECIEMTLRKEEVSPEQLVGIENQWRSVEHVFENFKDIRLLESRVIHPMLQYQGCIDCVGSYKDLPVVVEFKTSTKPKLTLPSTYDDPLQLAAYIGALNYDEAYNHLPNIDGALLVVAYSSGLPAHVHLISREKCRNYWKLWLGRLEQYFNDESDDSSNVN